MIHRLVFIRRSVFKAALLCKRIISISNWGTTPELPDLLPGGTRRITYQQAISEAFETALQDPRVRIFGEGVTDKHGFYGTLSDLPPGVAAGRVFDVPVAEGLITGVGVGMALGGLRPIVIHPRNDFLLLGLDQLCNHAAKWKMMTGQDCPLTVVTVACRGWGSAAQHSQALHATFAQFPGLVVTVPFTPAEANWSIRWGSYWARKPSVVCLDKWLWTLRGDVPPAPEHWGWGTCILRAGTDLTICGIGYGAALSLMAAPGLAERKIRPEVMNLWQLKPLHAQRVIESVAQTGRLLVVDTGHLAYGASAEIIASVVERVPGVKCARIGLPDSPVPACDEQNYFPSVDDVVQKALQLCAS